MGSYSETGHRTVGKAVADLPVDLLYTFGKEASYIAHGALNGGLPACSIIQYEDLNDPETLATELKATVQKDDVVLFKASRAVALERVIALLK
jgi:UDP-N-acetylmuramoyl-tripeptide--D-alanyl-D-alanine ligase